MTALRRGSRGAPAFALALLAALGLAAPVQAQLASGDLLVADYHNARVWRVRPNGDVSAFSPRDGSGSNLLVGPTGIAIHPGGRVFVIDHETGELVEIDPDTGAQRALSIFLYDPITHDHTPGTLGDGPYGLDIDPLGLVTVTTSGSDELLQGSIEGDLAVFAATQVAALGPVGPFGVAAMRLGIYDFVAVANGPDGWVEIADTKGEIAHASFDPNGEIWDAAIALGAIPVVFFVEQVPAGVFGCDSSKSGIRVVAFGGPGSLGGLLRCPFAIAVTPDASEAFVAEADSRLGGVARVVRVALSTGAQSLVAELPPGDMPTLPAGIALVPEPVPEPAAGAASLAALLALATKARRLRATGRRAPSALRRRPRCRRP